MGRSKWKGYLIKKENENSNKNKEIQIINKSTQVYPKLVNKVYKVYSGKKFIKITITHEMIGHRIGEFLLTRAKYIFKQKKLKKQNRK